MSAPSISGSLPEKSISVFAGSHAFFTAARPSLPPGNLSAASLIWKTPSKVESVPHELQDAAEIDGAGTLKVFFYIIVPVIKPILATIAIFAAVAQWNAFQDTLLLVTDPKLYTLQFVLYQYINQASSLKSLVNNATSGNLAASLAHAQTATSIRMTVSVVVVTPIMLVYPFFQRYFTKGIMIGAVKG